MGANVYQDRGGDRTFTGDNRINDPTDRDFDATLEVSPKNDVGFYGGVKLGYVFGTGVVRPTIEGDFFYNGFRGGADFTLRDRFGDTIGQRNVTTWINTGAFMANFILRFAPGNQRFQPYAGAGVGIYYAESAGVEVVDPVTGRVPVNTGGGASHADLAWQVIAGSDYYWNPKYQHFYRISLPGLYEHPNQYKPEPRSGSAPRRRGCSLPLLKAHGNFPGLVNRPPLIRRPIFFNRPLLTQPCL